MKRGTILPITLLVGALSARCATYYVTTNGNNSLDGTSWENAWLTVSKATASVAAGDTVYFGAGTWAETLTTATSGGSENRITWDGQAGATVENLVVAHEYQTFQNLTISGASTPYLFHVSVNPGGHWGIYSNLNIVCQYPRMGGFRTTNDGNKPWGTNEASNCVFTRNTVQNISDEYPAFRLWGTNNLVEYNTITNGLRCNGLYLHGRWHVIRGNVFLGLSPDVEKQGWSPEGSWGHPDLIQTLGSNGEGSLGHVIERNVFLGDWSPELQATNPTLAEYTVAGGQLTVGGGLVTLPDYYTNASFEVTISRFGVPYEWVKGTNDISLEWGDGILTNTGVFYNTSTSSIATITGIESAAVTCLLGNCAWYDTVDEYFGGWVFRNNVFANTKSVISMGLPDTTWENNLFYRIGYTLAGHPLTMGVTPYRNDANNFVLLNNVFLDCGSATNNCWYNIGSVTNYTADYNLVRWEGGAAYEENPPSGFRWYETNGINGGDPVYVNVAQNNFRPMLGSALIDAGTNLTSIDLAGWSRPRGSASEIGPYEFDPNLRVWLDFDQGFDSTNYIADITGHEAHAWFPMETDLASSLTNWASWDDISFDGYPSPPLTNRPATATAPNRSQAGVWSLVGTMTNDPPQEYGLSQYAAITNIANIEFLTNGTISVWVKWGTIGQGCIRGATILDSGHTIPYSYPPELATNAWSLRYGPPYVGDTAIGPLFSRYSDNSSYPSNLVQFTQTRDASTWYHLAVAWDADADTVIGYENGAPIVTNSFEFPYLRISGRDPEAPPYGAEEAIPWLAVGGAMHAGSLTWGDDNYPNDRFFVGAMDDLMIWDRTLSAAEVELVYGAITFSADDEEEEPPVAGTASAVTANVGTIQGP